MKSKYIIGVLLAAGMSLTGCDDFLNDNRYPMSQQTVIPEFWNNSSNVQNQINYFYEDFAGYGNGSSTNGTFYYMYLSDDQCGRNTFANWKFTAVPTTSSSWNAPYTEIRRANLVISGVEASTLPDAEKTNYMAIARMYRARMYYDLVRRYGDVPLVKIPLDPSDEAELFGPRTDRNTVMDFVLEDINYACQNIATESSKTVFSRDMATAMKTEMCLFEGAYAKYHSQNNERAEKYYKEAASAAESIVSKYPLCDDYASLYRALNVANSGYPAITSNKEVIFAKVYVQGVFMHSMQDYSSASDGIAGITKDAFDDYLFLDGRPASSTEYDTTDKGVPEGKDALNISNLLAVRDQRLAKTTYDHVLMPGMAWSAVNTAAMWSRSGYGVSKYNNLSVAAADVNTANKNYTCAPLFWGARLYLAILEAKAELGTLSDTDITNYLKPLWDRAGITVKGTLDKAWLENLQDPNNDMGVSSLIWEIRRCRRCELIMDDDVRYWDLIRWHQLEKLDTNRNPAIIQGANVSNSPIAAKEVLGDYLNCSYGNSRSFEDKHYFYPIPSQQLALNKELTQNPGW